MSSIYVGQTDLKIRLTTGRVKQVGDVAEIHYKKPTGKTGFFPATFYDDAKGIIEYTVQSDTDIDKDGMWLFWAKITDVSNKISIGEATNRYIKKIGEI